MSADARRLLLVLALPAMSALAPGGELGDADFADPFVLRDGAAHYAFATGARGDHIQVARSVDLVRWARLPDALPVLPAWAAPEKHLTWAPSVLKRNDAYVLYYVAADTGSGFQCISRARSSRPEGPYTDDSDRPFVCQADLCGSIDPSPFVDADGRAYLYWKSDENAVACGGTARLWGQELTVDGLSVTGAAVPLLAMDRAWERPLIEAPSMVLRGGVYTLFYSAGWYDSPSYAIGYATCERALGPCTKVTLDAPFLGSVGPLAGPGGQEIFEDASNATWMAFHAWTAPRASYASGGARALRLVRLSFANGVPSVTLNP